MARLSPPVDDPASDAPTPVSRPQGGWRGRLANPATTFLVVALAAGAYLACVVPHFGGIDETAHFFRSYQLSTGRLLPLHPDGSEFSGACIPNDVVRDVLREGFDRIDHSVRLEGRRPGKTPVSLRGIPPCPGDTTRRFVTFS